jgi:parvulin-like peptidyl-prolyl isomerase
MRNKKADKEIKLKTIIISAAILIFAFLAVMAILIYGFNVNNKFTKAVARIFPYPAAIINSSQTVRLSELNEDLNSVKNFYESQDFSKVGLRVDFSTNEGKNRLKIKEKEVLNKLIENKIIEALARQKGIKITKEIVDQSVSRKIDEYGNTSDNVESELQRLYGWKLADFKNKIVAPSLYQEELAKIFDNEKANNPANQAAKKKIEQALEDLKNKKDFSEVARTYSEGSSAENSGEMGWFKKGQLIPELADKVFSMKVGERSDIIESALGYHIVELEDKKTENNEDMARIRQIFTRQYDFSDWLTDQMKNFKIFIPLKDYYWNRDESMVEFRNEKLKEFENKLPENSQGDASVLF